MATPPSERLRFVIFASGRGSNASALMDAFESGFIPADLVGVISNVSDAPIVQTARQRGYNAVVLPSQGIPREEHEGQTLQALADLNADHVLLAGYMRILSPFFLREFSGSILNIHPSLLPEFPGLKAAHQQWDAGVKVAGATVHHVEEKVDAGPVILQGSLVVRGDEGPGGLEQRILHEVEHEIYPRAVRLFVDRWYRKHTTQTEEDLK